MSKKDLKNKPLVEAILEFKWKLTSQTASRIKTDPHYSLLLGRFSEKVERDYPFHEPLPTTQVPDAMVAHMAQHRFRTSEKGVATHPNWTWTDDCERNRRLHMD